MKKLSLLLLLCIALKSYAQFNDYFQYKALSAYAKQTYGLEMGIPKDMYVMSVPDQDRWNNEKSHNPFITGGGIALKEDKNCMLVYPFIETMYLACQDSHTTNKKYMNIGYTARILADSAHAKATEKVLTNPGLCGGADTIIISELKLSPSSVKTTPTCDYKFNTQVNILMCKKGFLPMVFRIYFNQEGLKHKDQTIDQVLQVMKFGNRNDFIEKKRKDNKNGNFKKFLKENGYAKYFPMTSDFYELP